MRREDVLRSVFKCCDSKGFPFPPFKIDKNERMRDQGRKSESKKSFFLHWTLSRLSKSTFFADSTSKFLAFIFKAIQNQNYCTFFVCRYHDEWVLRLLNEFKMGIILQNMQVGYLGTFPWKHFAIFFQTLLNGFQTRFIFGFAFLPVNDNRVCEKIFAFLNNSME